jgi:hypothetical protein
MREKTPGNSGKDRIAQVEFPLATESIEYLRTRKKTRVFLVVPLAQTYMEVLQEMKSSFGTARGETPKASSLIPFLVTSAAALECLLNII